MIDFTTSSNEDLEKTQRLPALTADAQLDEALQRERAAQIEIVELKRQNLRQAKEIEQLRERHIGTLHRFTQTIERSVATEEGLFEACGALKDALSKVLGECRTQSLTLNCESAARRAFEDSCDKLERILSAPGFSPNTSCRADVAQELPLAMASLTTPLVFLSMPVMPGDGTVSADEDCPHASCV